MNAWADLFRSTAARHGLTRPDEAVEAGLSRSAFYVRSKRDDWWHPHVRTHGVPGVPRTDEARLAAALTALGAPAAATRWSAAWLYGLRPTLPTLLQLVTPHTRHVRRYEHVEVLRSRTFDEDELVVVRGLACVPMSRLPFDLAATTDVDTLRGLVIDAIQQHKLDLAHLMDRLTRKHRIPGTWKIKQIVAELDAEEVDSVLEYLVRQRLREDGFRPEPAPVPVRVRSGRTLHVDIGFLPEEVGIECKGLAVHGSRLDQTRDHVRENDLASSSWTILQLGWDRFVRDWTGFTEQLEDALDRARHG